MTKDKIFHQQVIDDNPFPNEEGEVPFGVTQSTSGERVSAEKIPDQGFPKKKIATEVISTALNTKSRKILAEFEFTESGALQIGKYANGVSGDLRVSPNGITARNDAGTTTFAIDGTTGDAVFKGTVQAGTFIAGEVIVGEGRVVIDGTDKGKITIQDDTDTTIIDAQGLISTANFTSVASVNVYLNQNITAHDTNTDITGSSLTFTLARASVVLIVASVSGWIAYDVGDVGSSSIRLFADGSGESNSIFFSGAGSSDQVDQTGSINYFVSLDAGSHTIKLVGNLQIVANTPIFVVSQFALSYAVLGK